MKLIFVYGPPAVGKLTVARELAALTGYQVFHNHLVFDLVAALFEPFSEPFLAVCDALRLETFALAARHGLDGLIFTFCYSYPHDNEFVDRVRDLVNAAGGEVCFVQLVCALEALKARVVAPDRKQFRKLSSPEKLEQTLSRWDLDTPIPHSGTLRIDNTHTGPLRVAEQIAVHHGLPRNG